MARPPKLYQKLVRRRSSLGGEQTSLWLAADHVLQIQSQFLTERYQRVRFADVQGFFILPSREARWVTITSTILTILFGALSFLGEPFGVIFVVLLCLTLPFVVYGIFFARDCHFYAVTAVQRAEWANVARRRQARRLIARLDPLIREVQRAELEKAVGAADAAPGVGGP